MHNIFKGIRQRSQQISLSQRLILGLVLVVVAIIIFSGVPANIAMWLQLERQVWEQVEDAQAATQALYDAEITRLMKLAGLFAGRPTLYQSGAARRYSCAGDYTWTTCRRKAATWMWSR